MANREDVAWFKATFGDTIDEATKGTSFTLDMLTALACQETGEIWRVLRKKDFSVDEILRSCVGDTLERKKTFPRNHAELKVLEPHGEAAFKLARELCQMI